MRMCTLVAGLTVGAGWYTAPLAAQGFEGVVAYKMSAEKAGELTMSIKGANIRSDMTSEGRNMAMLMDGQNQTMTMLMPEQKMYMTMDLKGMRDRAMGMEHGEHSPPKITPLGTSETIAGRTCQNFLVESDKSKTELCNAKGLGYFMMPRSPMGRGPSSGMPDLESESYRTFFKDGFFPLRVVNLEGDKRRTVMEATRVEPKSLDASLFTVPADYKEMRMPGGMGPRPQQ